MWCPGHPFTATITGSRAGRLAGNPAPLHLGSSAPTRWGAPHGGVPQGGAPLWGWWCPTLVGSHIAWGTTPRLALSDLALRTTWSSRSRRRALLTVSLVLTVSLRPTTRSHGYLTNHGGAPPGGDPLPQEGSRERPTDTTRAESAQALPFGSPTPALTGVAHVVPPVWSTSGVGAPCRRASTARHQDPGWTQPETHHRVSLTLQRVGDPAPSSAPQLRHTPKGGDTTPTHPGCPTS